MVVEVLFHSTICCNEKKKFCLNKSRVFEAKSYLCIGEKVCFPSWNYTIIVELNVRNFDFQ